MKSLLKKDSPFEELSGYHSEVMRFIKPHSIKNKTVLDVGCGFGWCEFTFSKYHPKKMIGIDPSEESIKIARKFKHPSCSFKIGNALKLPFKDNTFDTVMSWEVLEHIPKNTEEQMFKEIYRVLKPGGQVFLSTQYRNFFATVLDPAWWFVGHRHYRRRDIKNFAEKANLSIKKIYTKGGMYTIIGTMNMYFSKWILRRNRLFNEFFIKKSLDEYSRDEGYVNVYFHGAKSK